KSLAPAADEALPSMWALLSSLLRLADTKSSQSGLRVPCFTSYCFTTAARWSLRSTCERSDGSHGSAPAACARPLPPAQGPRRTTLRLAPVAVASPSSPSVGGQESPASIIASVSNSFIRVSSLPKTASLAAFQLAIFVAPYM